MAYAQFALEFYSSCQDYFGSRTLADSSVSRSSRTKSPIYTRAGPATARRIATGLSKLKGLQVNCGDTQFRIMAPGETTGAVHRTVFQKALTKEKQ
jgi:hypothetical protein